MIEEIYLPILEEQSF